MVRRFVVVLAGVLVLVLGALGAGSAWGALPYPFDGQLAPASGSFGDNAEAGNLTVAVDDVNGDTYVADSASGEVDVFETSSGKQLKGLEGSLTPAKSFGGGHVEVAANDGTGEVYVLDSTHDVVDVFEASGGYACQITGSATPSASECNGVAGSATPAGGFNDPGGLAVDQKTGEVYVVDANNGVVDIFGVGGGYVGKLLLPSGFEAQYTRGIAVDDFNGDVYIAESGPEVVYVFNAAGEYETTWTGSNTPGGHFRGFVSIAADNTSGRVYVTASSQGVDVFEPSGVYVQSQFGKSFRHAAAVAVDQASGRVDVYDNNASGGVVDVLGPAPVIPGVTTGTAGPVGPQTATPHGTVDPEGLQLTDCHFDYVAEGQYEASAANPYSAGQTAPCVPAAGAIPADSSEHAVSASIAGLQPGTTYHFRLQAENANGIPNFGGDATFATPPPPSIEGATTANLTASSVDLAARVNPQGADTTYHFEYGTTTAYGASVPVPDADIGAGTSNVPVATHLSGLSANTTYHWRVVAHNANGTTSTGDQTFVYDTSGEGLPDGRAYEMVTPPLKNSALIGFSDGALPADVSADGSRLILNSVQCFAGAGSCTGARQDIGGPYEFTRTGGGWVASPMAPAATQFDQNSAVLASVEDGTALFTMPTPPGREDDWYARQPGGSFVDIGPQYPPVDGAHSDVVQNALATADLSHVVYTLATEPSLFWPFDASVGTVGAVYEYVGGGNAAPALVGVSGGLGSTDLISVCGTELGTREGSSGALSADGGTVFFTALACSSGSGVNAGMPVAANTVYARIGGSRTVRISAGGGVPASFVGASTDGSRVFFTEGENLYEYDFASPAGHNVVTVSAGDTSGGGPRVQGVVAISPEGSHVYFVAQGVLSGVANSQGAVARSGAENLYVFERDASYPDGRIAFVGALSGADIGYPGSDSEEWRGAIANVTPDGRFLVFTSRERLTADDTSTTGVAQVFRYDALTGELARISVGERGFDDNGNAGAAEARIALPVIDRAGPPRSDPTMSDDGSFVFFQSPVGLIPRALNDVRIGTETSGAPIYANNVYEWHEGHVYLISDGSDTSQAGHGGGSVVQLVGSDASGANVFFSTSDPLVAQDTDTQVDYYDARVCTVSSPCVVAPASVSPCAGEGCRGAPEGAPSLLAPGSAAFAGAGNLTPAPAAKPAVKPKKKKRKGKVKPRKHAKGRRTQRTHGGKARRVKASRVGESGHVKRGRS